MEFTSTPPLLGGGSSTRSPDTGSTETPTATAPAEPSPSATPAISPTPDPACSDEIARAAVSGQQILFTSDRDGNREIYLMNLDGSGLTNLTQHPAEDWGNRWSPSGDRISFLSDRDGNEDLYLMNWDGSNLRRITDTPRNKYGHEWSPGEKKIAFISKDDTGRDIYVVNPDGSGLQNLTQNPARDWRFAWSPDGGKIAFVSDRDGDDEIYVINADGTGLRQLTRNQASDDDPVWSPDGRFIVFESNVSPNEGDGGAAAEVGLDLYTVAPDGTKLTLLTKDPQLSLSYNPVWSKDGRKILFASILDFRVWPSYPFSINVDGTGLARLSDLESTGRMNFVWSPDWERVAVHYGNSDAYSGAGNTLGVFNFDGSDLQALESNSRFNSIPAWTMDSEFLVFRSGSDETAPEDPPFPAGHGINIIRAEGTCFTRLTNSGADDNNPILSPKN